MRVLVAGLGSIGRRHLRNLRALGVEDLVLLRSGRATLPDDELAGFPAEREIRSALRNHRPDAVVVATPTSLHLDVAIPAARAGCHLLLEKPIAASMDRVPELVTAVAESDVACLVGFHFRFHPVLAALRARIEDRTLGSVAHAEAHWGEFLPGWHPWEDHRTGYAARRDLGGGVALTLCHPFDYLRWLLGEVVEAHGIAARRGAVTVDTEDTVDAVLRCASGALATVHLNYLERPGRHTLDIVGDRATARWNALDHSAVISLADGGEERLEPPAGFERNTLYVDEMRHFIECVEGKAAPRVTLADGVRALEIALAVRGEAPARRRVSAGTPSRPARPAAARRRR